MNEFENKLDKALLKKFQQDLQTGVERGESLEQLSERIAEDTVPNFYGANFRTAYNEGFEQGSAYGYEQPLDLHDAMMQRLHFLNSFPQEITFDFNKSESITEEAEFEVVEPLRIEDKTGATFVCEVQAIGGKRCVVQCDTCRNNEGQLIGQNDLQEFGKAIEEKALLKFSEFDPNESRESVEERFKKWWDRDIEINKQDYEKLMLVIFDHRKNLHDDCGDGSSEGIYKQFEVYHYTKAEV